MFGRYKNRDLVKQLDPQKDYEKIVYIVGTQENPWLMKKALEFALFRTYAIPHTSKILQATGQFERHGQKRYDDTSLMLAGMAEHGIDSDFGKIVIASMNRLHGSYNIRNEDMLYVLSTFALEPIRWGERYGWRKPEMTEKLANFYFWRAVGKRMGIEGIPDTLDEFFAFNIAHEKKYFQYDKANRVIGEATIKIFLSWYPSILHPIIRQVLYALMDEPLLKAMNFPKPLAFMRPMIDVALDFRSFVTRHFLPPRRKPYLYTERVSLTYPKGFKPEDLGAKVTE